MADQEEFDDAQKVPIHTHSFTPNPLLTASTGGLRQTPKAPRGIYFAKGETPAPESSRWLAHIESTIRYRFSNPDLLEEALETPGSGVVSVGATSRMCADGNFGLARVGEGVMVAVEEDACYVLGVHAKDIDPTLKRLLHANTLSKIGRETGIDRFVRPKAPLRESQKGNPMKKMLAGTDRKKTVAQAMKAILGAVYYDAGFGEAQRVCIGLGITPRSGGGGGGGGGIVENGNEEGFDGEA